MKKFAVILVVLSLTRIGVAYADTSNPSTNQNYFFGTKAAAANLNQVLALLVGPEGKPGPAGVAGKDGLIGMDGKDGADGLPGAPGAVGATGPQGPAGASVLAVAFTGAQGTCTSGGVKFTDGAGSITYTCNGLNGSSGDKGDKGDAGTGGGLNGGFTYAQGALSGTCDDFIFIAPIRKYDIGGYFVFGGFKVGDKRKTAVGATTNGGVAPGCMGQEVTFEFFTNTTSNPSKYTGSDHITCTSKAALSTYPIDSNDIITLNGGTAGTNNSGDFNCTSEDVGQLALADLNMKDYTDKIGFSIG